MFDLVRLQRLQMQPPDPIVQIGVLRTMVSQMIDQSHTFEFRLNSFETQHSLSGAATATQQAEVTATQSLVLLRNLMRLGFSSVLCACDHS